MMERNNAELKNIKTINVKGSKEIYLLAISEDEFIPLLPDSKNESRKDLKER